MGRQRFSTVEVLGRTTTLVEQMDPEISERPENAWTRISAQELDELRCAKLGVEYVSPEEAARREKMRPSQRRQERKTFTEQLSELLMGGIKARADGGESLLSGVDDAGATEIEDALDKAARSEDNGPRVVFADNPPGEGE